MIGAWYQELSSRYPGIASQLRNGSALAGSQVVEAALRGVYALLIGAMLGPAHYGVWSYVATAYMVALALSALGLETLAEAQLVRFGRARLSLIQMTLAIRLASTLLLAAGVAVLAWLSEPDPLVQMALFLAIPAMAGRGISSWARSVFTGLERGPRSLQIMLPFRLGEFVIGLGLLGAGYGVVELLLLHACSWSGEAIANVVALRRIDRAIAPRWHGEQWREVLRQGAIIGSTVAGIGLLNAGPIMLAKFYGVNFAAIGSLGIAQQVAMLGVFVVQGFMAGSFPVLRRGLERGDSRISQYGWLACFIAGLAFALAALLADWFAEPVFAATLGTDFTASAQLLPLCLVTAGLSIAPTGFWQVLVLGGRIWVGGFAALLAASTMMIVAGPAATRWGIYGLLYAAIAGWLVRGLVLIFAAAMPRAEVR